MAIIETLEVSLLPRVNKQAMKKGMRYLDNRASNHMTSDHYSFQELRGVEGIVRFGDSSTMKIGGRGWILLQCKDGGQKMLYNVLYVINLKTNILSLDQFDEQGYQILIEGGILTTYDQHERL